MPRPDSPSVFGAILDRGAGHFRLGPYGVSVPAARRYLPGSLILETTWQTHTGWLIVRDALVMGPWHDIETAVAHPSPHPDGLGRRAHPAAHRAMRERHRRAGDELRAVVRLPPQRRQLGVLGAAPTARRSRGASQEPGLASDAAADHQPAHRAGGPRGPGPDPDERGRQRLRRAELVQAPGAADLRRGRRQDVADQRVLAAVDQHRRLPRPPVAVLPAAQRADAEGPDVLADRRAAGGQHHVAAGNPSGRTQLGLPLRVGARLDVRAVGPVHPGPGPRGRRLLLVHRRRVRRQQRRTPSAAGDVRRRRRTQPGRGGAAPPVRLRQRPPGADRQRRLQPDAARHLGHDARFGVPARQVARADPRDAVAGAQEPGRGGHQALARTRPRHLGGARRAAALHLVEDHVLGGAGPRRRSWPSCRARRATRSSGARSPRRSRPTSWPTASTPAGC